MLLCGRVLRLHRGVGAPYILSLFILMGLSYSIIGNITRRCGQLGPLFLLFRGWRSVSGALLTCHGGTECLPVGGKTGQRLVRSMDYPGGIIRRFHACGHEYFESFIILFTKGVQ